MRRCESGSTTDVNARFQEKSKKSVLGDILEEYCLKRNLFNPTNPSPNVFLGKLEKRMKIYYKSLYNSSSRSNK